MNCSHFQDNLLEYVEGTLSADELAVAQKHLAECGTCRQAVEKEKRLASALSSRLRRISKPLTLHPEILRNILAASRQASAPMSAGSLIDFYKYWLRIAAIPAAMLLVAGVLMAIHFSGTGNREVISVAVTSHPENNPQPLVSVEMSYRLPRHEFHQKGNLLVDTLVDEAVVVNESIPSGSLKTFPQKLDFKTPL